MEDKSDQTPCRVRGINQTLTLVALGMIVYHLIYVIKLPYEPAIHAIVHIGFAAVVLFLVRLKDRPHWVYGVLIALSILITIYFISHYEVILEDPSYPPVMALWAGVGAAAMVFLLTYQTFGWVFPALTALSILYMAFGHFLPDTIRVPAIDLDRMITLLSADVTSPWGVYGKLLILSANYLFLFIFFGAALEAFGGLRFVMAVGSLAASKFRSGAAALSVFSSALLGSVTGSTVANITITGSFTIPLMRKGGYSAEQAAAIETAASSGGQILPPIMGATVFVMAGYTGIPYLSIVYASIVPALLYFSLLLLYAELNARKLGVAPMKAQPINFKTVLLDAPVFIVPLALLMICLIIGFSLMRTILICIVCITVLGIVLGMINDDPINWKKVKDRLVAGVISGSQIAAVLALIGITVATVEVTGLGMKLGNILVALSGGSLFVLLMMTALTAMILGVGLPTPAAYILSATILSPALIQLGVPLLQAHLFPLYYAVFSHLTPPIGIGLMVACKMAEANYLTSAFEALKAAVASFLFPFFFVYAPALVLDFEASHHPVADFISVVVCFFALSLLINGFFAKKLDLAETGLLLAGLAALLVYCFFISNVLLMAGAIIMIGLGSGRNMSRNRNQAVLVK